MDAPGNRKTEVYQTEVYHGRFLETRHENDKK